MSNKLSVHNKALSSKFGCEVNGLNCKRKINVILI